MWESNGSNLWIACKNAHFWDWDAHMLEVKFEESKLHVLHDIGNIGRSQLELYESSLSYQK
jgi:hypothetical protein